ncbi:MAG: hypothetical protein INH34_03510 [Phycisphaerales bacterium]|nr:hypothetical protein [Phycisphaerales bacterium]
MNSTPSSTTSAAQRPRLRRLRATVEAAADREFTARTARAWRELGRLDLSDAGELDALLAAAADVVDGQAVVGVLLGMCLARGGDPTAIARRLVEPGMPSGVVALLGAAGVASALDGLRDDDARRRQAAAFALAALVADGVDVPPMRVRAALVAELDDNVRDALRAVLELEGRP